MHASLTCFHHHLFVKQFLDQRASDRMCSATDKLDNVGGGGENNNLPSSSTSSSPMIRRRRRSKRDKEGQFTTTIPVESHRSKKSSGRQSKSKAKHGQDAPSGGFEALIPSLIGLVLIGFVLMGRAGFRGRATVVGMDLGTTNSVICVQAQSKGVGEIQCTPDPSTGSPIIPSVVSLLPESERPVGPSSKVESPLHPHPSSTIIGSKAKHCIDSHPQHTLYNAKRVLGKSFADPSVQELVNEVEFTISTQTGDDVIFQVDEEHSISPHQVGSYIIYHMVQWTRQVHPSISSAVITVPAQFTPHQRQQTALAYQQAGLKVARILEEPTAAALAYGLHLKEGVEKILVYDFGGGTLDISILHVSDGFCDVLGVDGDSRLGGADLDAAIAHALEEGHSEILQRLKAYTLSKESTSVEDLIAECPDQITDAIPLCSRSCFHTLAEQLKIGVSSTNHTATAQCWGLPSSSMQEEDQETQSICETLESVELTLTPDDFWLQTKSLLQRSLVPVERLLQDLSIQTQEIDEVVLIGGTTRLPHIRQLVQDYFAASQINFHIDPDITVAYGAASVND